MIYCGGFKNFQDVAREFDVLPEQLGNVYIAIYDSEQYEGYAFVLTEIDGKLYEVNGSHCSCNGLEGQWKIEITTPKDLEFRMTSGNLGRFNNTNYVNEIREALKKYQHYALISNLAGLNG